MSDNAAKHTPGPWSLKPSLDGSGDIGITALNVQNVIAECFAAMRQWDERSPECEANARLIAASPTMAEAIKGLIGLCQMLRNRDDCPSEIRQALTHNHRIIAGYEALSAAGIEGFQPSDFDAARASLSKAGE